MSDPTLDQIAAGKLSVTRVLARELKALSERMDLCERIERGDVGPGRLAREQRIRNLEARAQVRSEQPQNDARIVNVHELVQRAEQAEATLARLVAMIEMGERVYRCGDVFKRAAIPQDSRDTWTHGTWIPRDPTDFHEFLPTAPVNVTRGVAT